MNQENVPHIGHLWEMLSTTWTPQVLYRHNYACLTQKYCFSWKAARRVSGGGSLTVSQRSKGEDYQVYSKFRIMWPDCQLYGEREARKRPLIVRSRNWKKQAQKTDTCFECRKHKKEVITSDPPQELPENSWNPLTWMPGSWKLLKRQLPRKDRQRRRRRWCHAMADGESGPE